VAFFIAEKVGRNLTAATGVGEPRLLSRTEVRMAKRFFLVAAVGLLILTGGYADQTRGKIVIAVDRTSPTDGKTMYSSYCAPCHGADGRGRGPAAQALRTRPADLTTLTQANHGKYPDTHIFSILQFGARANARASVEMPVWGPILAGVDSTHAQQRNLRIVSLIHYLESIQAK
jgi:mono/diheme cytochrome c family protein